MIANPRQNQHTQKSALTVSRERIAPPPRPSHKLRVPARTPLPVRHSVYTQCVPYSEGRLCIQTHLCSIPHSRTARISRGGGLYIHTHPSLQITPRDPHHAIPTARAVYIHTPMNTQCVSLQEGVPTYTQPHPHKTSQGRATCLPTALQAQLRQPRAVHIQCITREGYVSTHRPPDPVPPAPRSPPASCPSPGG
jgi:hypothetical protein